MAEAPALRNPAPIIKLLGQLVEEADAPAFYYDLHEMCHKLGCASPAFSTVMRKLVENGFSAYRTCFCPTGIKTDASSAEIAKILK